jgi:transposase
MTAPMVLDGPMDGPTFLAWIEQMLAPTLGPGGIVVMDNLPAHKPDAVRPFAASAGMARRIVRFRGPECCARAGRGDRLREAAIEWVTSSKEAIARIEEQLRARAPPAR